MYHQDLNQGIKMNFLSETSWCTLSPITNLLYLLAALRSFYHRKMPLMWYWFNRVTLQGHLHFKGHSRKSTFNPKELWQICSSLVYIPVSERFTTIFCFVLLKYRNYHFVFTLVSQGHTLRVPHLHEGYRSLI